MAKSGVSAAKVLHRQGTEIFLTEKKTEGEMAPETLTWLKETGISYEFGGHTSRTVDHCDEIVISPGVPWEEPMLMAARKLNIPVISELEFATRNLSVPCIAVTGTNGKTTTTSLISAICSRAGWKAPAAGNIGLPASELIGESIDLAILEVSSFQLEGATTFHPKVAVLLNITPDHIDRHATIDGYGSIKKRVFQNQTADDFAIWNAEDPIVEQIVNGIASTTLPFHRRLPNGDGAWLDGESSFAAAIGGVGEVNMSLKECILRGRHNAENMMAAALATLALGIQPMTIRDALHEFPGVPHRLETVGMWEGREFVNDSKATNPESAIVGIRALAKPSQKNVVVIAGGEDKGTGLAAWVNQINQDVKNVILIGKASGRFSEALRSSNYPHVTFSKTLLESIQTAMSLSEPGDIILLSPACASFDMFRNYEDRGDQFRTLVQRLTHIPTHAT